MSSYLVVSEIFVTELFVNEIINKKSDLSNDDIIMVGAMQAGMILAQEVVLSPPASPAFGIRHVCCCGRGDGREGNTLG